MTDPLHPRDKLFVLDEELPAALGVPEKLVAAALQAFDVMEGRFTGFPQKQKLWGNRRYLPAVKAYFDREYGLKIDASPRPQSQERRRA